MCLFTDTSEAQWSENLTPVANKQLNRKLKKKNSNPMFHIWIIQRNFIKFEY